MDHCAFLKEFERDKYIAVLTDKELTNVEKGKFQLLEKVSNTKIDAERMAVTISVGVSPSTGTLEEKDRKIINLRYYQSKTQVQTAKILNMTQVQVSRREKKILTLIRQKMSG